MFRIDEADRDGDGEINMDEFLRVMKKAVNYIVNILVFSIYLLRPEHVLGFNLSKFTFHIFNNIPNSASREFAIASF